MVSTIVLLLLDDALMKIAMTLMLYVVYYAKGYIFQHNIITRLATNDQEETAANKLPICMLCHTIAIATKHSRIIAISN